VGFHRPRCPVCHRPLLLQWIASGVLGFLAGALFWLPLLLLADVLRLLD
jgi:hypothetical protein